MEEFVHEVQCGFLPKKTIKNIRTVLDIIEYLEQHNEKQLALIF